MQAKDGAPRAGDYGHMKHASTILLAALGFSSLALAPAVAADAANGLKIARHWCVACHVISPDQKQGSADTPSFADIARRTTETKPLAVFLTTPHGQMPDMTLSQPEIADIIAYIRTLGPPRAEPPVERKPEERPKNG